jgi:acetate kinase
LTVPIDTLIFTGGIGKNAAIFRKRTCQEIAGLEIVVDIKKKKLERGDRGKSFR